MSQRFFGQNRWLREAGHSRYRTPARSRTPDGLRLASLGAALIVLAVGASAQDRCGASSWASPCASLPKAYVSYAEVLPLMDVLRPHLPPSLMGRPPEEMPSAWGEWVRAHDAGIRARVARGEEDSLVNFWLFGTSFTAHPPARPDDVALHGGGATLSQVADRRFDDLMDAVASAGSNERVRFAAQVLRDSGIDPATTSGRTRARALLAATGKRMLSEHSEYEHALAAPNAGADPLAWMARYASLYHDRGLSPDTSLLSSFAIDTALEALTASGRIGARSIRRVAVVGPGLDVINKAGGHDFYPEQTIQPFALIDSLVRLGLSRAGDLSVTTFDVSARVNQHIASARGRARAGDGYVVHLPLGAGERWSPALVEYWRGAGVRIGDPVQAARAPASSRPPMIRAVRVRPDVVLSVMPRDLDIVLERLDPLAEDQRFDLVVATNVFVYYDRFEQALAMTNVARMLRPGGSLLSNAAVSPVAPLAHAVGHEKVVYSDRQFDHVFWYQRP